MGFTAKERLEASQLLNSNPYSIFIPIGIDKLE